MAYNHNSRIISYFNLLHALLLLFCFLNNTCIYGARRQPLEMKSFNPPSALLATTKGVEGQLPRVLLGDYGEGIYLPVKPGNNDGEFLVTVGFGTPKSDFHLLFDTGSSLTWIQCQPCTPTPNCNTQFPIFDPSSSSTFENVTCDSPTCNYNQHYHDGSFSNGSYASDILTLTAGQLPNFIFGCAQNIEGNFGGADGLLGLAPGNYSLVDQTDGIFLRLFCYCLPRSRVDSAGFLVFGVQAFETCQPNAEAFVPMTPAPNQNKFAPYLITLTAITLGQQKLEISSYRFGSLQAILDSGTIITRLPPSVYSALSFAFQALMSQYPKTNSTGFLDTCYNLEGESAWTPPSIVLHFENSADVRLDESAAVVRDASRVCLAFAGNKDEDEPTIIGSQQHLGVNIFFDVKSLKLAFQSGGCFNTIP